MRQKPEDVPQPQETRQTEERPRRPESKPRVPDDTTQRKKDVASSKPKKTEPQTSSRREKQRKTQTPKEKQQPVRQDKSPSIVVPAANPEDDTPEQREVREHWQKSFEKIFQQCGYRTPIQTN
jgi:hypothetical protein